MGVASVLGRLLAAGPYSTYYAAYRGGGRGGGGDSAVWSIASLRLSSIDVRCALWAFYGSNGHKRSARDSVGCKGIEGNKGLQGIAKDRPGEIGVFVNPHSRRIEFNFR